MRPNEFKVVVTDENRLNDVTRCLAQGRLYPEQRDALDAAEKNQWILAANHADLLAINAALLSNYYQRKAFGDDCSAPLDKSINDAPPAQSDFPRSLRTLIFFAGGSGTGKTSVMQALMAMCVERGESSIQTFESVVRDFYKSKGLTSTDSAYKDMNPRQNFDFQMELLRFYTEETRKRIRNSTAAHLIFDRSIFCHMAYTLLAASTCSDLRRGEVEEVSQITRAWSLDLSQQFPNVYFLHFPPNAHWMPQDPGVDAFRRISPAQNVTLDAFIEVNLAALEHKLDSSGCRTAVRYDLDTNKPAVQIAEDIFKLAIYSPVKAT